MDKCFFSYCEDEALKIKVEGMPVHRFFSPESFMLWGLEPQQGNYREKSNGGYAQIVDMPIDEFLGLAEPIPDDDEKRHAKQEDFRNEVLSGKKTDWNIPYLIIIENEDGIWKVVGHDGRHRAMLLKSIGYDEMPVLLEMPEARDLNEELLPEILWCQNDKSVKRDKDFYPFPITEDNFNKPYAEICDNMAIIGGTDEKTSMDEEIYPAGCDSPNLKKYLAGDNPEAPIKKGSGKAPESCMRAKKNFAKNFVSNVMYRKDNTMPASTLKEFLEKKLIIKS